MNIFLEQIKLVDEQTPFLQASFSFYQLISSTLYQRGDFEISHAD